MVFCISDDRAKKMQAGTVSEWWLKNIVITQSSGNTLLPSPPPFLYKFFSEVLKLENQQNLQNIYICFPPVIRQVF